MFMEWNRLDTSKHSIRGKYLAGRCKKESQTAFFPGVEGKNLGFTPGWLPVLSCRPWPELRAAAIQESAHSQRFHVPTLFTLGRETSRVSLQV